MLRKLTFGLAALAGLLLLLVAALLLFVDANRFKPQIERWVEERYQRTLTIHGDLHLRVLPRIALSLPRTTLSEAGGTAPAASIEAARIGVALRPLLRGALEADALRIEGLQATVAQRPDGSTSIDDLIGRQPGAPGASHPASPAASAGLKAGPPPKPAMPPVGPATPLTGPVSRPAGQGDQASGQSHPPAGQASPPAPQAAPSAPSHREFDIGSVAIVGADITWIDEASGRQHRVSGLDLNTGRVGNVGRTPIEMGLRFATTQPVVAGELKLKAVLDTDFDRGAFVIRDLAASAVASVDGHTHSVDLEAGEFHVGDGVAARRLAAAVRFGGPFAGDARLSIGSIDGTQQAATVDTVRLTIRAAQGLRRIGADVASPAQVDFQRSVLSLSALAGEFTVDDPSMPVRNLKIPLDGSLSIDAGRQRVQGRVGAAFDETRLQAKFDVTGFDRPRIGFDVDADRLNLDRYLATAAGGPATVTVPEPAPRRAPVPAAAPVPAPVAAPVATAPATTAPATTAPATTAPATAAPAAPPPVPVDLEFLRDLNAAGRARIGELQAYGIKGSNVRMTLKAGNGRLDLAPLQAQLYGGTADATASVMAAGSSIRVAANLVGVAMQPLLRDAAATDMLEGRGNLKMALTTAGADVEALKRGLDGTASLRLSDGAIRGINLAQQIREAKRRLAAGRSESQASDATQKTDFSEITASFVVRKGVAFNDDLDGKSPLLRARGSGKADIGAGTLDYLLRVTVADTSKGQGGREVEALSGITIPVHLTGPFAAPEWRIDWAGVAQDALKSRAGDELLERVAPQIERLKEERDRVREQLKGGLRGLFSR